MKKIILLSYLALSLNCLLAFPTHSMATAGGGHVSHGSSNHSSAGHTSSRNSYGRINNSPHARTSLSFNKLIIFSGSICLFIIAKRNNKETIDPQESIPYWAIPLEEPLKTEISSLYLIIQKNWSNQTLSNCQHYYSEELYLQHLQLIQNMQKRQQKNIIKKITIESIYNYTTLDDTQFKVTICATMIDYIITINNKQISSGDKKRRGVINEDWYFKRKPNGHLIITEIR
ncbi:hypothetical protein [Vagococcus zengguangii]|uniref:Uncharacterized protein n=1 Tax=Vagococcus zengguangii TaxID=2571750 RepID=A0A4D7CP77_9ENTE|nr:hypothetical protein [Vagococcus zengguangii]QCI85868.1 hypothetical protein FA707_02300 [Vagococcus zengguangii]TLG81808.1 hypothetical protein FE258_01280 [Vagococcus zengguangii]